MDASCLCFSLPHNPARLAGKRTRSRRYPLKLSLHLQRPSSSSSSSPSSCHELNDPSPSLGHVRRPGNPNLGPSANKKLERTESESSKNSNPLRSFSGSSKISGKLWLSSKLLPPQDDETPPELTEEPSERVEKEIQEEKRSEVPPDPVYREEGKIFVGNLPLWVKKKEVAEFFRQFGPLKNVVLIKGHDDPERNMGYCFVIYGGPTAANSAMKAVEFDGVEFHGRILTVKLDDGRRLKARSAERSKWLEGSDSKDYRSKWHEERHNSCKEFRRVLDTEPENWQSVVSAFQKIKKPSRREFGLMVNYYARRGDKHHARATFETMRARGIEPNSYVYTNLVHAYAVARDMQGAVACVQEMKAEDIEMTLVTYSILIAGFANIGDAK
ncbi:RNA-binding protein 3 [Nymphaea thermarum]|nr:RNA-binding protein 3 [Nymphaea thermarum]